MDELVRWNQLRDIEAIQHGWASLRSRSPLRWPDSREVPLAAVAWAPVVDISEDEREYRIKAELPEVRPVDVKVTTEGNTLTIAGERKFELEVKGRKYHRIERAYGSFVRRFALPDDARPAAVTADFKDGILILHLAKSNQAGLQRIEVQVEGAGPALGPTIRRPGNGPLATDGAMSDARSATAGHP